jgi:neopullulanase
MKKILFAFCCLLLIGNLFAQNNYQFYPTHWFTGMKLNKIQLMIHGDKIAEQFPMIKMGPAGVKLATGVNLMSIKRVENANYIFLDISIDATAKPDKFNLPFLKDIKLAYELKARRKNAGKDYAQGVTSKDFIYLLMPDRFSNGDESNDKFADMNDTNLDRANGFLRHGGDLKGIENHLDYFNELGVTSLWLTPVIENDMHLTDEAGTKRSTYHGYAFTDHYKIDKRFGGNEGYKNLIDAAHKKGLKIIQDAVYNHVGNDHFFIKDLPMKDWVHQWPVYTNTSYKEQPLVDPYASDADRKIIVDGWFTPFMPDLNQSNDFVANFLLQHAIWTVEEFGIDGWRVDTYFYSDKVFLNRVNDALLKEYPSITVVGENSMPGIVNSAYFTNNTIGFPFKHNLMGTLDFPLTYAMLDGLKQDFGWNDGVSKLYSTLAADGVYKDPMRNSIFLDNHDFDRVYSVIGENMDKYKMGITWLLTLRGIPHLYYGTEILMKNFKNPTDAEVRRDFPGGWAADKENKFLSANRTPQENEAFNYMKVLAGFRKNSSAIKTGKLMQFVPQDGVYVYFRYDNDQTVMVIANTAKEGKKISFDRFAEKTKGFSKCKDVISGSVDELKDFTLGSYKTKIIELVK